LKKFLTLIKTSDSLQILSVFSSTFSIW